MADGVQTVEKALEILILMGEKAMSLTEIAEATGYNKSTVHRLLATLCAYRFAEKDARGKYAVGLKVVELGSMHLNKLELKTEAAGYLHKLATYIGQAVHLGIRADREVVYIDKIEPINTLRMFSEIGKRVPLYCTALGKALLTECDDREIEAMYADTDLIPVTPHTITSVADLIQEVHRVRAQGYATDREENEPGIYCIAAPVCDYKGTVIASLSTSVGNAQWIKKQDVIDRVKETALSISAAMGYRP